MLGLMIYLFGTAIQNYCKKKARLEKESEIFANVYGNKAVDILKNNLLVLKGLKNKKDNHLLKPDETL